MAVPTIASVTPAISPASGTGLVTIVGTNFRLYTKPIYPAQSTGYTVATWPETMFVLFDGLPAYEVKVQSATQLTCRAPGHGAGTVGVTVGNLDDSGNPIGGESASAAGLFTYVVPSHTASHENDLTRTIRQLLRLIKAQLLVDAVTIATNTDYDPTTGDELHVTEFAKFPGIALVGPDLVENRFYSVNDKQEFDRDIDGDGNPQSYVETDAPYTIDVKFTVIGASDNKQELLNLSANFIAFMHRNKYLYVNRSPTDPTQGAVKYEFDFETGGQPKNTQPPGNSNIRAWASQIVIRGFDIEAFSGLADGLDGLIPNHAIVGRTGTAETLNLDPVSQIDVISGHTGPSPGR